MTVLFDTVTGRLRLSPDSWEALRLWSTGRGQTGEPTMALHDAGVIDRGRPHTSLIPALEAVLDPLVTLSVEQRDHDGRRLDGTGWVTPGAAALLLDAPDDLRELVTVHPALLPAALARVVGLGPRARRDTSPVRVPDEVASQLMGPDASSRQAAVEVLGREHLPDVVEGPWNHWSLGARWGRNGVRGMTVLDTPHQIWMVEQDARQHVLWPTDPTMLWRLFTRFLPDDDELGIRR